MHRFFVPPHWIKGTHVTLGDPVAHQVRTVLRMQAGDQITVLDNAGWQYVVTLHDMAGKALSGTVLHKCPAQGEPAVAVTLYQSLLKKDNYEWVLQKCTEIGVARFVPFASQRTVVPLDSVNEKKYIRWERIISEAAEQSRRGRIPELGDALALDAVLAERDQYDCMLMPWEDEQSVTLRAALDACPGVRRIAIIIGPEGGFSAGEIDAARARDVLPVTLGPRILRAETAAVAACVLALYETGALDGPR